MTKNLMEILDSCEFVTKHVTINEELLYSFSNKMIKPIPVTPKHSKNLKIDIYNSIMDSALQFCFWYGNSSIRINNHSSSEITRLVKEYSYDIELLKKHIRLARFPNIESRTKIIDEIGPINTNRMRRIISIISNTRDVDSILSTLTAEFDSFANDILLKKALLTVMSIHFKTGIIKDPEKILIPADYQIPKMLRHFGILKYSNELAYKVDNNILLLENSEEELAIRIQAIKAVKRIQDLSQVPSYMIDQILFHSRKNITSNHHLTITTSY
jgi:hypothetical protein